MKKTKDSNDFYHSQKDYLSSSAIKTIAKKSVLHFMEQKPFNSPALTIGSAFHTYVLENELFFKEFIVAPKIDRRKKAGKEEWTKLQNQATTTGKQLLAEKDFKMICIMSEKIFEDKTCKELLSNGEPEVSFYRENFIDIKARVRPDYYKEGQYIVDLKSCQDASPRAFRYDILKYGWHIQAAFYMDVLEVNDFYFIASEKQHPYACQTYKLSDHLINEGRIAYMDAIASWKNFLEFGTIEKYKTDNMTDKGIIIL